MKGKENDSFSTKVGKCSCRAKKYFLMPKKSFSVGGVGSWGMDFKWFPGKRKAPAFGIVSSRPRWFADYRREGCGTSVRCDARPFRPRVARRE